LVWASLRTDRRDAAPAGEAAAILLSIFELEKAIYELQYALEKRADYGNSFTIDEPMRPDRRLASSTYICSAKAGTSLRVLPTAGSSIGP
jgi:hypothetical protein